MRALSVFSLTLLMSAPSFAADLGTYRPGTPYQSVVAQGADVCESHCAGDAQCRGWNYVKANPKASGVCEFLSTVSSPLSSQISISGVSANASSASDKLVSGGTNTVRVGTAVAPNPRNSVTRVGNRNVIREAVPQKTRPQTAATQRRITPTANMSLTEQQNLYRQQPRQAAPQQAAVRPQAQPQFRDPRIVQQRPQAAPQQFRPMLDAQGRPQLTPQQQYQLRQQQMLQQQHMMQRRGPARARGTSNGRPPIGQPIQPQSMPQAQNAPAIAPRASSQMMPRSSAGAPVTHQNAQQAMAQRQSQLGMPAEQVQQSLYGSLHDDVAVPAANSLPPIDPNAPMATAASRPTNPVSVQTLPGLAGAPRPAN